MVVKAMKIINLCSLNSQWCPFCILIKACPPWGLGHPNRQSPDLQGWKIPSSSGDYWENGKMSHSFAYMLSCFSWVWIFVTLWTIAHHGSLSRDSPGKNTGVTWLALLQVIFLTQGSNLCLLYCKHMLYSWAKAMPESLLLAPTLSLPTPCNILTRNIGFSDLIHIQHPEVWLLLAVTCLHKGTSTELFTDSCSALWSWKLVER